MYGNHHSTASQPTIAVPELRNSYSAIWRSAWWRMTENDWNKRSPFHTKSLRRIPCIFSPNKISNEDLLRQCNQDSMATILIRRRWKWIGRVIRRDQNSITKTALHWTPEGNRKRGRPKNTWRRTVERKLKSMNHSWGTIEKMAKDRHKWRTFVAALHANGIPGSK